MTYEGELAEASAGDSVIITLEDELDISRGDMIVRRHNLPQVASQFECTLCWMSEEPLNPDGTYLVQHTTRQVRGQVAQLNYRIDMDTLHREPAHTLQLNEIGRDQADHQPAALLRSVPDQPCDRRLYPDRSVHQQHGGRRHDPPRRRRSWRRSSLASRNASGRPT